MVQRPASEQPNLDRMDTARESRKQKDKETDNMQKDEKKTPDNTNEDDLTKVQQVSAALYDFSEVTSDFRYAINYLMDAIDSIVDRLEDVLDDDEMAEKENRTARTLLVLLAEQAEKLKNEAISYDDELMKS
jgi:hypothetical protein